MTKRYSPIVLGKRDESTTAEMKCNEQGEWIDFETFKCVIAQKDAKIARLKRQLEKLEKQNAN